MHKICIFLLLLAGFAPDISAKPDTQPADWVIKTKTGTLQIQVWAENIVHVVFSPGDNYHPRPSLMVLPESRQVTRCKFNDPQNPTSIKTSQLEIVPDPKTNQIIFRDESGKLWLQEGLREFTPVNISGEATFHARQIFHLSPDEGVYGLGQHQQGHFNYRGQSGTLVQENTVAVVPFLVSTKNYGILWDNYSKIRFTDGPDGMSLWSEVGDAIDYYFIAGASLDEVIAGYRTLTGPVPLFGKWAYGYWQSRERYQTQAQIIEVAREFRTRQIPLDVIIQDWQYWGELGWSALDFDRRIFPDPKGMLQTIHDLNLHYLISIWPRFDSLTAVYKEMDQNSFLCADANGRKAGLYDAYHPGARQLYWKYLEQNLFSIGADGWWIDATEPEFAGKTPDEIAATAKSMRDHAGGTWARYLNAYSLMSTKGVYESQRAKTEQQRVCILTRSAYGGQQRFGAITWSGDIVASWEVLRNQISAGLNFSLSGLPYWTTDIGAFIPNNPLGCRDEAYREIYVRWFQFGTFCPIFRSHGTGTPREPWQFGDRGTWAYDTIVKFDRLRYRLLPYLYALAWQITSENYTPMRGLPFDFAHDPAVKNIDNAYMFGPAFLVCPVTEKMYFENTYVGRVIPAENLFHDDGSGLTTDFYNGQNFDHRVASRVESKLDFDWNAGSRPAVVNQHDFSIRFTGQVLTHEAGEYTFITTSNDGIRVWVNDKLVIDNWTDHGVQIDIGKITLAANTKYNLKMEYYQTLGGAITKLAWITPSETARRATQAVPPTKSVAVYLPEATGWVDFWTGKPLKGGQTIQAPAPIDQMPLFVKAGTILPLGPEMQYASEKPADPMELRIYSGADAVFVLYEDENDNYQYEKGAFATIPLRWNDQAGTLTIGERQGKFPGMPETRQFHVVFVNPENGSGIELAQPDQVVEYSGKAVVVRR